MATESTETLKGGNAPTGPNAAAGQAAQTTAHPQKPTVFQENPKENTSESPELREARERKERMKQKEAELQKRQKENDEKLGKIAEEVGKQLDEMGIPNDQRELFFNKLRLKKSVGAAPLRFTSGGNPEDKVREAQAAGLAPQQGSF